MITYDEEGNAYTLKKEDSGQITIIEQVQGPFLSESIMKIPIRLFQQQAAINSITAPGGHAVQVQTVPLSQATTSVPGGLGAKQQFLQQSSLAL